MSTQEDSSDSEESITELSRRATLTEHPHVPSRQGTRFDAGFDAGFDTGFGASSPPEAVSPVAEALSPLVSTGERESQLQTQRVLPLTESQLHALMDADPAPSPQAPSTAQDTAEDAGGADDTVEPAAAAEDTAEDERISSSDASDDVSRVDPDTTPAVLHLSQMTAHDVQVIDETPLKPVLFPTPDSTFVFLLSPWTADATWWPCRASRRDWDEQNRKATVLFRDDEEGPANLAKAVEFDLRVGDVVHYVGSRPAKRRYEVIQLSRPSATDSVISTFNRSSEATLRFGDSAAFDVPVADLYLTANDMKVWRAQRASTRAPTHEPHMPAPRPAPRPARQSSSPVRGSPRRVLRQADLPSSPTSPFRHRGGDAKRRKLNAIFRNCVFSISSSRESKSVAHLIESLGGTVLANGLSDVVRIHTTDDGRVALEPAFGTNTMAAVLADAPRRTPKYLEMVALGWPCLSTSYIKDCVESDRLLDWLAYTLPAGRLTLDTRKQDVSADCALFHRLWLLNTNLQSQFVQRRVTLLCACPIFVLLGRSAARAAGHLADALERAPESRVVLLAALSAPPDALRVAENQREVPHGSLVLDLDARSTTHTSPGLDPALKYQMKRYASLSRTIKASTYWLAQCIISGEIV